MNKVSFGKFLSLILRHKPQEIGLQLDTEGWADVSELLAKLSAKGHKISRSDLDDLVATNDKKRYAFSADGTKIRASQGHSIAIDLKLQPSHPPDVLFHGTADRFVSSILSQGLVKGSRNHVHLSADVKTASKVGSRHGKLALLLVDAKAMVADGLTFYLSENKVWLTDHVPAKYLSIK